MGCFCRNMVLPPIEPFNASFVAGLAGLQGNLSLGASPVRLSSCATGCDAMAAVRALA